MNNCPKRIAHMTIEDAIEILDAGTHAPELYSQDQFKTLGDVWSSIPRCARRDIVSAYVVEEANAQYLAQAIGLVTP